MTRPLSLDLRERIADAIRSEDQTHPEIAARFAVSITTVERISRKLREGRSLEPGRSTGRPPVLREEHKAFIREQLEQDPFVSSYELATRFNRRFPKNRVHRSTILRAMHGAGFSFKKKRRTRRSETEPTSQRNGSRLSLARTSST